MYIVRIEREHNPPISFGPYPTRTAAIDAMENNLVIDDLCQEDALDAEVEEIRDLSQEEPWIPDPSPDYAEG